MVSIQGVGFSPVPGTNVVTFNGVASTVDTATPTVLTTTVPINASTGPIQVVVGGNTYSSPAPFTVAPIPYLSALSVKYAVTGSTLPVTATGVNLTGATFAFGPAGVPPGLVVNSALVNGNGTSATLNLTANAAGTYVLVATSAAGSSTPFSNAGNTLIVLDAPIDLDSDGLDNVQELAAGTDPTKADTDNDGMPDGWELRYHLNPLSPADAGALSAANDTLTNLQEYLGGTDPTNSNRTIPAVTTSVPSDGSIDQLRNFGVVVTFNEQLLGDLQIADLVKILSKVAQGKAVLTKGGENVPGTFALSGDGAHLTFTPAKVLDQLTTYTLTLSGFRSLAGVPMAAPRTITFKTNNLSDLRPPTVVRTSPSDTASNVPPNSRIAVEFSKPMDVTSITAGNFVVKDLSINAIVTGALTSDATGRIEYFTPLDQNMQPTNFSVGRNIQVQLFSSIVDTGNNHLDTAYFSFTTGFAVDTLGPALTGNSPQELDINIPVNTQVKLSFSEPVNRIAAAQGIQVNRNGNPNDPVDGVFNFFDNDRIVLFQPTDPYAPGVIKVSATAVITDVAGNQLGNPSAYSFTVDSPFDSAGPAVTAQNPPADAVGVSRNVAPTVTFNERMNPLMMKRLLYLGDSHSNERIAVTVATSADRRGVTLTPVSPLAPNTLYCVSQDFIGGMTIQDLAGNFSNFGGLCFTTGNRNGHGCASGDKRESAESDGWSPGQCAGDCAAERTGQRRVVQSGSAHGEGRGAPQ